MTAVADRHVLFGLLAVQTGLIQQSQLIAAFQAWTAEKATPLADHLVAKRYLTAAQRPVVEALAAVQLDAHGGDAATSLAAIPFSPSTLQSLAGLGDPDIEQTLTHLASGSRGDAERTASYSLGTATSDGQRFRVLRPLARGGLGAVFVALDSELHREVALKQILDQHADDPVSRARFLLEAEITGGLEHPGIVPVYGLGTHADGRPFYAMRLVNGDSLREAADRFHADESLKADPGRRSLELRQLLRRFTDVCNAIDYAHSRGVLHRDLKPGNIIVGKHGETLVVDWGLAKAMGQGEPASDTGERALVPSSASGSAETLPGSVLGTPAYMSPEQAKGNLEHLGTRSDVYSLGATLYYLLSGRPPFAGDVHDVIRAVQRGEFPPPRQLDPTIDRALEAVCKKAMAHRPEDRYAAPRALAEDVDRWMADEPVSAWREPIARQARRWARRNRTKVTAAAVALIAGVFGLSAVLVVQARANASLAEANSELSRSRAAVQARYQLAVDAIRTFHTGVSQDFLLRQTEFKGLRDKLLAAASDFYGKLGALLAPERDLASRRSLATSNFDLAQLTGRVGRSEEALAAHRAVLASREALAAEVPSDPQATIEVGRSLTEVGNLLATMGRTAEATATYRRSESLLAGLAGRNSAARAEIADCRTRLGGVLSHTGRYAESLAAYRQARADQEVLAADPATSDRALAARSNLANRIGTVLSSIGRMTEAEAENRAALALANELVADRPADPERRIHLAQCHYGLSRLLNKTGRTKEAVAECRRAQEVYQGLVDGYPAVAGFWNQLAMSHNALGVYLSGNGERPEAEIAFRRAVAIQQRIADDHPAVAGLRADLAGSHLNLGNFLRESGQPAQAELEFRAAIPIQEKLVKDHPETSSYRDNLAGSYCDFGALLSAMDRPADAETEIRAALAIQRKLADDHPAVAGYRSSLAGSHLNFGLLLSAAGRPAEAEAQLRAAVAIQERLAAENPAVPEFRAELGDGLYSLGGLLSILGRSAEAKAEYQRALALCQKSADDYPTATRFRSQLASCRTRLGTLLRESGSLHEAGDQLRAALALRRELAEHDPTVPALRNDLAGSHSQLADLLRTLGQPKEALDGYSRAIAIREELLRTVKQTTSYRSDQACTLRGAAWRGPRWAIRSARRKTCGGHWSC